jgi:hypothetical protein
MQNDSKFHRVLQIIYGALLAFMLVYGALPRFIIPKEQWTTLAYWPELTQQPDHFASFLLLMAGVLWIVANVLPTRMREASMKKLGPHASPGARYQAVQVSLIIRWAMLEAVALAGFMLAFLENAPNYAFPPLGLAVSTMLAGIPTGERLRNWAGRGEPETPVI